jgi:excisionase family DNA binding protein
MEGHMQPEIESPDKNNQAIINAIKELVIYLKKKLDCPMTFDEACQYLKFTGSYLYKLCSLNSIPCYKPKGKVLYFFPSEMDQWLRSHPKLKKNRDGEP